MPEGPVDASIDGEALPSSNSSSRGRGRRGKKGGKEEGGLGFSGDVDIEWEDDVVAIHEPGALDEHHDLLVSCTEEEAPDTPSRGRYS